jgi:hypothetical protein
MSTTRWLSARCCGRERERAEVDADSVEKVPGERVVDQKLGLFSLY